MMSFYENFDIQCIKIKPKKEKKSPLIKYKNLYYWILHQSLTDSLITSHNINFDHNNQHIDWNSFVNSLDSLRILGILRPVLKGRNLSKDPKWISLSKSLISQISNLLFIKRNDPSHIVKCISLISRFSSYSLSNGRFDSILLSLNSDSFTSPIDTAHIIKGYVKAKRFEPLLFLKLLNHIKDSDAPSTDKNTAIAISLNAISQYWWHWNELDITISDLIHPKDIISIINIIGKFDVSDELIHKTSQLASIFISKIFENSSNYTSNDLSRACKSLVHIALSSPENNNFIQILRSLSFNICTGPLLIDVLSAHVLAGLIPPIDLVVRCVIQLKNSKLNADDLYKLKLITHTTGFTALGFRRTFKKVLSSITCTGNPSLESILLKYKFSNSKISIPYDLKIDDLVSITKFHSLSNIFSILCKDINETKHFIYQYAIESSKIFNSLYIKPKWLIEQWPQILFTLEKFKIIELTEVEDIIFDNLSTLSRSNLMILQRFLMLKLENRGGEIWEARYLKTLDLISRFEINSHELPFLKNVILFGLEHNKIFANHFNNYLKPLNSNLSLINLLKDGDLKLLTYRYNGCGNTCNFNSIWNLIKTIAIKSHFCFKKPDIFHVKPIEIALLANLYTLSTPIIKVRHRYYWMLDSSNLPNRLRLSGPKNRIFKIFRYKK